jgi:hypothetical protein
VTTLGFARSTHTRVFDQQHASCLLFDCVCVVPIDAFVIVLKQVENEAELYVCSKVGQKHACYIIIIIIIIIFLHEGKGEGGVCCMFVVVVVVVTDERSTIKSWVWVDLRKKTREGVEFLVGER